MLESTPGSKMELYGAVHGEVQNGEELAFAMHRAETVSGISVAAR